jgi:Cft2 family RNA processing exonuclease
MKVTFHGAIDQVTGSCTHLHYTPNDVQFLVDCGMMQGSAHAEFENAKPFPFDPKALKFILLTHAHLDHCGLIPRLYKEGFMGSVYCTRATARIAREVLLDSARITKNEFYSKSDVERVKFHHLDERDEFSWGKQFMLDQDLSVYLLRSAHILGACAMGVVWREEHSENDNYKKSILFSGDIGPTTDSFSSSYILKESQGPYKTTNYVVMESTKGDAKDAKSPTRVDRLARLKELVKEEVLIGKRSLLIPAFSVHRMQEVLYDLITIAVDELSGSELLYKPYFSSREDLLNPRHPRVISRSTLVEMLDVSDFTDKEQRLILTSFKYSWSSRTVWMRGAPESDKMLSVLDGNIPKPGFRLEAFKTHLREANDWEVSIEREYLEKIADLLLRAKVSRHIPIRCESGLGDRVGKIYSEELFTTRTGGKNLYFPEGESEEKKNLFQKALKEGAAVDGFSFSAHSEPSEPHHRVRRNGPTIIISSSGMCEGGCVAEHLAEMLPQEEYTVVLTGYQASNTNGSKLLRYMGDSEYVDELNLNGTLLSTKEINARIVNLEGYSGHASSSIMIDNHLSRISSDATHAVFLNHGTSSSRKAFKKSINHSKNTGVSSLDVVIPRKGETFHLKDSVALAIEPPIPKNPVDAPEGMFEVLLQINQNLLEIKELLKNK